MRQEGEPSVEEILESIKKVMARDADRIVAGAREPAGEGLIAQPGADPNENEDVLDLDTVAPETSEAAQAPGKPASDELAEGLTNTVAADSMRQSLAALAMLSEPSAKPQIVRSGETSLEDMVRDLLRPLMAQWLDAHLPEIVERLVKEEITRIAGKKR
ncbi:DUF2497 domain-containing protein [Alteraurantiacibacter aquimixticola]|uniref:DUF2497 domain-containing protein n=1 Tax=Alteraurantiacibacter aquimixticola TaxID=2489173 RepID=A0A4T3EYY0_9SPHN|nr:DUF2497 domain-containing protein [Alteraurantiacibacter aquimixticola]TIX49301.1 DUF2497 domain-containing protein [Alteraurantiacibacter aquimixticola]